MAAILPNTTTTNLYKDCVLGGDAVYDHGSLVIANNPASVLMQVGANRGTTTEVEYPYVTPTSIPLVRGEAEFLIGLKAKSAITGLAAQVSGWLLEPGKAGFGAGSAFSSLVTASGTVGPSVANINGITGRLGLAAVPSIQGGSGMSGIVRNGVGDYTVSYTTPFAAPPTVVASGFGGPNFIHIDQPAVGSQRFLVYNAAGALVDGATIWFIAVATQ